MLSRLSIVAAIAATFAIAAPAFAEVHVNKSVSVNRNVNRNVTVNRTVVVNRTPSPGTPDSLQDLVVVRVVHGDRAAPPVAGGSHPFRICAVVGDELRAQRLGGERLARHPGVIGALR